MATATLTSKGQITLPREIRDFLRLGTGDRVDFVVEGGDRVLLRPTRRRLAELRGMLHVPGRRSVTLAEMEAAIRKRATRSQ